MTGYKTIYDISVTLGEESIPFPGDPPFSREMLLTIKDSGICDVSKLVMSAHSGTHIDTPAHFIMEGNTLEAERAGKGFIQTGVVGGDVGHSRAVRHQLVVGRIAVIS